VWSMIEQLKQGRCVFLTTHSMEEADFLGDSIAIMHTGKLRANGSSLFLKTRFGKGHTISLLADASNTEQVESVARELPGSEILSSAAGNISVSIPRHAVSGIPRLFQKLMPADSAHLIKEWGISNTTLEEVFLRLCAQNSDINAIAEDVSGSEELSPDGFMEILTMMQTAANAGTEGDPSLSTEERAILERAAELAALLQSSSAGISSVMHNARQLVERDGDESIEDIAGGAIVGLRQSAAPQQQSTLQADTMVQFVCPDGTGPGQQIQVQDPNTGDNVVVTLPPGAVPGQPIQVRIAPQQQTSDAGGLVIERTPTMQGQALNTMVKSFKLQKSQRKANCCYCCVFILMLLVNLVAGWVDSLTSQFLGAVVYCPVGDYQAVEINGISTCDLPELASYMALSSTKTEHMYRFNPSWSYLADSVGESISGNDDEQHHLRIWAAGDAPGISIHENDCFGAGTLFTRERCCNLAESDIGDPTCWSPPWFTYDRCCALVHISPSSDLTARVLGSQRLVQSEYQSLEGTSCDDNGNDQNQGFFIENRTSAIAMHQSLFPNFGIQYDEFTSSDSDLHLHYTLEFFQQYRYGGSQQAQFFKILTQPDPDAKEQDDSPWGGGRGGPGGNRGGAGRRQLQPTQSDSENGGGTGGRGGRRRGRRNTCDALGNQDAALDEYDLHMLENAMTNAVLRSKHQDKLITTSYVAMPQLTYADNAGVGKTNIQILLFPLTTMILLPSVAQLYTMEREDGLLHAMELASMQIDAYWIGMYLFTVVYTFVYSFLYIICGYAVGLNAFTFPPMVLHLLLALVWSHTQAAIAMLCSAVFTKARMATIVTVLAVLLTAVSGYVITNALDVWPSWLYVFLPFAYTSACSNLMVYNGGMEFYKALASLFFGSAVIIALVIVDFRVGLKDSFVKKIEQIIMDAQKKKRVESDNAIQMQNFTTDTPEVEDSDVAQERTRIADGGPSSEDSAIVIKNLVKEFDMGVHLPNKVAVRNLCLTVNKGEVFGLLGQNGAGKTTTINLLTGLHTIDGGSASVGGLDAATQQREIHRIIGVCPQFDKVWHDLTVQQHLEFYARVKGIESKSAHIAARSVAMKVGLDGDPYGKLASSLSGGMRRRLSIAIALIGNPDIVFFDEPTTGLDPETRRQLWDIIKKEQSDGRCVIITTHSMEEADALCTRIGIMGFGQLRCIGTQMHLKNKFGDGFKLTLNCSREGQDVSALLADLCSGARLVHS
jgi:ABC-type multidrug transport system ATPase subunit